MKFTKLGITRIQKVKEKIFCLYYKINCIKQKAKRKNNKNQKINKAFFFFHVRINVLK